MCHLDEASCFGDVCNVTQSKVTLLKGQSSAILEHFVALVGILLPSLVISEELATCALWLDQSPQIGIKHRLARR